MARLVVNGLACGPCELATTRAARRRGLLGRDSFAESLLLEPCRNVHTLGMRFAIDVAYLRRLELGRFEVVRVRMMPPGRFDRPMLSAHAVLEGNAGRFSYWGLLVGSDIQITP